MGTGRKSNGNRPVNKTDGGKAKAKKQMTKSRREDAKKQILEVITHYAEDDEDCSSDFYSMEVRLNGKLIHTEQDAADNGGSSERVEGLIKGLKLAYGKDLNVKNTDVPDGKEESDFWEE